MFEIREVSQVEATASVASCLCTWGAVGLLYMAVCC